MAAVPKAISIYAVSPGAAALKCETRIWDERTCVLDDDDFAPSLEIHVFLSEGETACLLPKGATTYDIRRNV